MSLAGLQRPVYKPCSTYGETKLRQHYLEAKNTANEEQYDEDQAHVTESWNLLFIGEVIRLHSQKSNSQ